MSRQPEDRPAPRILLVEDDAFVASMIRDHLQARLDARVVTAENGHRAAVALREGGPFDAAICDLMMPGGDGVEFVAHLADTRTPLPLVLISSADGKTLATVEALARLRRVPVLGSLRKPVAPGALVALLQAGQPARADAPQAAPMHHRAIPLAALAAAIKAGEIDVALEPQVAIGSGALLAVEAQPFWTSVALGTVPAAHFQDLARMANLQHELTDLVCRKALAVWADCRRDIGPLRLSINLSLGALDDVALPDRLATLATAHDIARDQLVVEVSEFEVAQESTAAFEVLARLRIRGIALAMDDFDAGFAALQQWRRMALSELKLDPDFLRTAAQDAESHRIVAANVRLAKELNLRTVALGVDDAAAWELAGSLSCDAAQGRYVGTPMTVADLAAWCRQR